MSGVFRSGTVDMVAVPAAWRRIDDDTFFRQICAFVRYQRSRTVVKVLLRFTVSGLIPNGSPFSWKVF